MTRRRYDSSLWKNSAEDIEETDIDIRSRVTVVVAWFYGLDSEIQ